ncbi:LysR family transcriptional regulator [Motiliproteus sp. SC1-56]|uniref:LysR family transcriptional regulator n=1 Tax=Motiliproteus sp. SC1-56 TaxID=2799565 RepID=UPI001A8E9183|nr:LysR family transcriptional regulator [Motiliproteus sp. SC1-56]
MATRFGFDLRALELFAQVAKSGNMSLAAQQLGMTQSSISQSLANLEEALQTTLFDRSVRPMKLTTAGRFLQDRSSQLLSEAQKTSLAIKQADFTRLRHIKIAVVDSIATAVGRSLVNALKNRAQDWSISTGLSHLHGHALLARNVDIIISDDALEDYPDLTRYHILREPFVLALPNDYSQPVDSLATLTSQLDFIRYSSHSLIGSSIERHLRRAHTEPPERLQLDNTSAIVASVSAGLGWTITTPLCVFQSGIKLQNIQLRRLPTEPLFRSLTLTARSGELGDLPQKIAEDSVSILGRHFLPALTEEQPWLEDQLTLGD